MDKTTIVIMAAGLGSRYGGEKQVDGLGPNNEVLMDYSIYDALAAGFNKVVFIIKKSMYESFKRQVGDRVAKKAEVHYVFQELDSMIPEWYEVPAERSKPFGTAHCLLCARDVVNEPFCVFNADDYYGPHSFQSMYEFLHNLDNSNKDIKDYSMVGYKLENTISDNGTVTRGICKTNDHNELTQCIETYKIMKFDDGTIRDINFNPEGDIIPNDNPVSMNFWGLTPEFFDFLEEFFHEFLRNLTEADLKKECLLPGAVDSYMKAGKCRVHVLTCDSKWFGVTYQEDRPSVVARLKELHDNGTYPVSLIDC
ncbi:MAG: nucleotidyltransferase [Erysipelotrichales bacterium]|nr:nucleotidyltransferase [Erysipelotrichales bacterium]